MPEDEDKKKSPAFRRICPQCRTTNYYKKANAGEVSYDGGKTYVPVDAFRCRDCKQDYMEEEMLVENYNVGKFTSERDGKEHYVHMHKDWRMKMHEKRQARKKREGKNRDNWILKQLKKGKRK